MGRPGTARHIVAASAFCVLAALAGMLLHSTRVERSIMSCNRLAIEFRDSLRFVSENDIRSCLDSRYGQYIGQRLDSIDLGKIENILEGSSAIMDSEAWTTDDGTLHISISQRAPVLRFMDGKDGFYVDNSGYIFPLHPEYTADVTVIEGHIPVRPGQGYRGIAESAGDREWISGMIGLDKAIRASRTWHRKVEKIYVRKNGDVQLKMNDRDEAFIIGNPTQLGEKFSRIEKYYSYIAPRNGETRYRTVNVKYKNQIICREKDT